MIIMIIEITLFKLMDGVAEESFLQGATNVQKGFLEKQAGYAGTRQLLKGDGAEWVDIVHWESIEDAKKAQEAAMGSETCMPMFHKIDPSSIKMMHLEQIKSWK